MSVLYVRARPVVTFDVDNADHRSYFADFVKYNTWGRCPVKFMAESMDKDLVSFIEQKMLRYYVRQEFEHGKDKTKGKTKSRAKTTPNTVSGQHTVPAKTSRVKSAVSAPSKASRKTV